jgi:hypothetical protein
MARTKLTTEGVVDLTAEEEAARDVEDAAFDKFFRDWVKARL